MTSVFKTKRRAFAAVKHDERDHAGVTMLPVVEYFISFRVDKVLVLF
jgi:hypothetical protein